MRRRILLSTIAIVAATGLLLGIPLMFTAWRWVDDTSRNDLQSRLQRIASEVVVQEGASGRIDGPLDIEALRLLVPDDGSLVVVYPGANGASRQVQVGPDVKGPSMTESLTLGTAGSLRVEIERESIREEQWQAMTIVAIVLVLSIAAGVVVAAMTASRLADPVLDVADRAERIANGDFRPDPRRHNIEELDRVSDVLDAATAEIADRLQRERQILGDVSHQLRSRLTAVRLRLDELSGHSDPDVVTEANAALGQVDRLTAALTDLVRASRAPDVTVREPVDVGGELSPLVNDFAGPFADRGRNVVLVNRAGNAPVIASGTPARLREAASVLIDNSLQHGGGTTRVSMGLMGGNSTQMILVTVSDDGPGIDDDDADRIFRRGFSGSGSSGLGLGFARALVESDGGRLALQTRRPPVFAIYLPSADSELSPDNAAGAAGQDPEPR